jgi:hypothetical protein
MNAHMVKKVQRWQKRRAMMMVIMITRMIIIDNDGDDDGIDSGDECVDGTAMCAYLTW